MTVRSAVHVPAALDCGCEMVPAVLNGGEPLETGGCLVFCPGHGLRHEVAVSNVVTTYTYTARRLDAPDPRPESVDA